MLRDIDFPLDAEKNSAHSSFTNTQGHTMKKSSSVVFVVASLCSAAAFGESGSYWEISSQMNMSGMAMPSANVKTCVAKSSEKDPAQMMRNQNDSSCKLSDIKTSGNKTTWKVTCSADHVTGDGELTMATNSYDGVTHMNTQQGAATMTYHGQRGASCDTATAANTVNGVDTSSYAQTANAYMQNAKNMQDAAMQQVQCNTDDYDAKKWINNSSRFLKGAVNCPDNKQVQLCTAVSNDAPNDAGVYQLLVETEKTNGKLIGKSCGLDMTAITKSICSDVSDNQFSARTVDHLAAYCPAEAKQYKEAQRAGRSYSSDASSSGGSAVSSGTATAVQGAKKLKSLLGF